MRLHCDVCEKNLAAVMCCADEAALCTECDLRVHAANKLANKHQRVSLLVHDSQSPKCDICQEKTGFIFCQEDRAVLCRDCDVSIHTSNHLSAAHARFLLTGMRVALDALSSDESTSLCSTVADESLEAGLFMQPAWMPQQQPAGVEADSLPKSAVHVNRPVANSLVATLPESDGAAEGGDAKRSLHGSLAQDVGGNGYLWRVDELLNIPELVEGYTLGDVASSKADAANLGDFDWAAELSLFDEQLMYSEGLHEVPQMPEPLETRSSKVNKGKARESAADDDLFVVPDLGLDAVPNSPPTKRRRSLY